MILSTWNFEYAVALLSMTTILFHYTRHPMNLFMLFAFNLSEQLKLIKIMLKSFHF